MENMQLNKSNLDLMKGILLAQSKMVVIAHSILQEPRKHITSLKEYKQFKSVVKKINDETINTMWERESRSLYLHLYNKQYERKEVDIHGNNEGKCK